MRKKRNNSRTYHIERAVRELGQKTVVNADAVKALVDPTTGDPFLDSLKDFGDRLPGAVGRKGRGGGKTGGKARGKAGRKGGGKSNKTLPNLLSGQPDFGQVFGKVLEERGLDVDAALAGVAIVERQGQEADKIINRLQKQLESRGLAPLTVEEEARLRDFTEDVSRARFGGKGEEEAIIDTMVGFEFPRFQSGLLPTDADAGAGILPTADDDPDPRGFGAEAAVRKTPPTPGRKPPAPSLLPDAAEADGGFLHDGPVNGEQPSPPEDDRPNNDRPDDAPEMDAGAGRRATFVERAAEPEDATEAALLKHPVDWTEGELRVVMNTRDYRDGRDGGFSRAQVQRWFQHHVGDGPVQRDATGRQIDSGFAVTPPPREMRLKDRDGRDLAEGFRALAQGLRDDGTPLEHAEGAQRIQKRLNRLNAKRRKDAHALRPAPLAEDGVFGAKTARETRRGLVDFGVAELLA